MERDEFGGLGIGQWACALESRADSRGKNCHFFVQDTSHKLLTVSCSFSFFVLVPLFFIFYTPVSYCVTEQESSELLDIYNIIFILQLFYI